MNITHRHLVWAWNALVFYFFFNLGCIGLAMLFPQHADVVLMPIVPLLYLGYCQYLILTQYLWHTLACGLVFLVLAVPMMMAQEQRQKERVNK